MKETVTTPNESVISEDSEADFVWSLHVPQRKAYWQLKEQAINATTARLREDLRILEIKRHEELEQPARLRDQSDMALKTACECAEQLAQELNTPVTEEIRLRLHLDSEQNANRANVKEIARLREELITRGMEIAAERERVDLLREQLAESQKSFAIQQKNYTDLCQAVVGDGCLVGDVDPFATAARHRQQSESLRLDEPARTASQ